MMHEQAQPSGSGAAASGLVDFAGRRSAAARVAIVEIADGAVYAAVLLAVLTRHPGGNALSGNDKTRLPDVCGTVTPWSDTRARPTSLRKTFVVATLTNPSMAESDRPSNAMGCPLT